MVRAVGPHRDVMVGSPIAVRPLAASGSPGTRPHAAPAAPSAGGSVPAGAAGGGTVRHGGPGLLSGLRIVDFSAFVAACQRGKRSLARNVGATQARPVVEALTEAFPSCRVRDLSWSVDQRREAAAPLPFPGVAGLIVIS
jgi:hypothetical protein